MPRILLTIFLVCTPLGCDTKQSEIVPASAGSAEPEHTPTPDTQPPAASDIATDNDSTPTDTDLSFLIRFGIREPKTKAPGTIRLATYNLENLFDDIDDPALSGRSEDIDDTIPLERRQPLADAIRAIDADILCVQEVESLSALRWFVDAYLADMGYGYVVSIDAGDDRGIEQAVLSRFPITGSENWIARPLGGIHPALWGESENWYAGEPIAFHRSPLRVDVEIPSEDGSAYRLTLLVVHQKSGRPGGYWREAEALGLMEILGEMDNPGGTRNIAILGDFNATPAQRSVRTYLDGGFTDLFAQRNGDGIVSHASGRRIDLILVNDALRSEIVVDSEFVLGTIQRHESMTWRDPAPAGYASDHQPVVVDLRPIED